MINYQLLIKEEEISDKGKTFNRERKEVKALKSVGWVKK
jgi:hypothetical protein